MYEKGSRHILNGKDDLGLNPDARRLIGEEVFVLHVSKGGSYRVAYVENPMFEISVWKKNLDPIV